MREPLQIRLHQVLDNNRKFLNAVLGLSEEAFLEIISRIGPSCAFLTRYGRDIEAGRVSAWSALNPTRGWCGQMTRFLKDYDLIPAGYKAYCDNKRDHYYFINDSDEVIDMTIYQAGYAEDNTIVTYEFNRAKFNPVRTKSSADAMRLHTIFQQYYGKQVKHNIEG